MGVNNSICLATREVLRHDDVEKMAEWLAIRARQARTTQLELIHHKELLHHACELGASRCVKHIIDSFPQTLNTYDKMGRSALECALMNNLMGVAHFQCAFALLEIDAVFHKMALETRGMSILHTVCSQCDSPDHARVVKLILGKIHRKTVKRLTNDNGDNPLHSLLELRKLQDCVFSTNETECEVVTDLQKYFAVVRVCAELLLAKGCDPSKVNTLNQTALCKLLSHVNQLKDVVTFTQSPKIMSAYIRGLNWVMEVLLKYGANPIESGYQQEIPLVLYTKILRRCSSVIATQGSLALFLSGLKLLCQYGADPNQLSQSKTERNGHPMAFRHLLSACLSHCLRQNRYQSPEPEIVSFLKNAYIILRNAGLDINSFMRNDMKILLTFLTLSRFPLHPELITGIKEFLKRVLCTGGDPNLLPIHDPDQKGFSLSESLLRGLQMQSSFEEVDIMGILNIFYVVLDQRNLNMLVNFMLKRIKSEQIGHGSLTESLTVELRWCTTEARSLQVLSRIAVHKCVSWRFADCQEDLNVPSILKRYIAGIE